MRCFLLATLAFASLCSAAQAWSDVGHKIICEIALRLAKPDTQAAIRKLMISDLQFNTFSDSCVFPDHPRIRAPEHFINLPRDSKGLTSDKCPQADKCVLTAITNDTQILSSKAEKDVDRLIALKSLGHWVGDIHQPLHVSFADDRGGNNIRVSGQCSGNLHATWDNCLVLYAVGPDVSEAATDLKDAITPAMQTLWNSSTPRDWANESFALSEAAKTGYCVIHGSSCDLSIGGVSISTEYLDANESAVKVQLQKASVRLAHILDIAFGN
jgi:S1/P1 Nuclease